MQSINRSTLLAAQTAAAAILSLGSSDALLTFGGDDMTRERLESLPENPSADEAMRALGVPVRLQQNLLDLARGEVSLGTAAKALEMIQAARKEDAKEKMWADAKAQREQAEARGNETSFGSFDLTS